MNSEQAVEQAIEFLERNYLYYPSEKYRLYKQVPLNNLEKSKVRNKKPQNLKHNTDSLKRLDSKWKKVKPALYINLPREAPRNKTTLKDITCQEDFIEYFENRFPDLEDGVYTSMKGMGKGKGFQHHFLLRYERGKVKKFKAKSNGTPRQNSSSYYTFPRYFRYISKLTG